MKIPPRNWLALFTALIAPIGARAADLSVHNVVNDPQTGVSISYVRAGVLTRFTAVLPEGGAFQVLVDGNRDGKWGNGPYSDTMKLSPTADAAFGVDTDIFFCAQYIYAASPTEPEAVQISSQCGARPSKGSLAVSAPDDNKRITTTYIIPNEELFGTGQDAAIVLSVWNKKTLRRYFSLAAPLILSR